MDLRIKSPDLPKGEFLLTSISDISQFDALDKFLDRVLVEKCQHLLVSDFNVNVYKPTKTTQRYLSRIRSSGYDIQNNQPTRPSSNKYMYRSYHFKFLRSGYCYRARPNRRPQRNTLLVRYG